MPASFYIGVKAVIVHKGKVLVLDNPGEHGSRHWDLPGGRIDQEESFNEALVREIHEELPGATNVVPGRLLNAYMPDRAFPGGYRLLLMCYEVQAALGNINLSDEHTAYHWLTSSELSDLATQHPDARLDDGLVKAMELALGS